ncbi:hypothetical protein QF026_000028 [Streptomyces aurantiacus]|uniref:hypothetical protein n=1 Tax=Streptomyces aurantiacus TaxID=47760 RepID=UPI002794AC03|nr:hypothetical protein [Streptomyces aurantiacus]MDQ0771562.1 hypothetical protein [Streptomyces aurantiacus]
MRQRRNALPGPAGACARSPTGSGRLRNPADELSRVNPAPDKNLAGPEHVQTGVDPIQEAHLSGLLVLGVRAGLPISCQLRR